MARPGYDPSATPRAFAAPGGAVVVHYVESSADAVRAGDADADGTPDFVEDVAALADVALARFAALGFRAPLPDSDLADDGGGARLDIYLRDLEDSDGSFVAEACSVAPTRCVGHVVIDNDFARFSYPSVQEAIGVLTSHELFHAVQAAYDADQPIAWSEGSAVWAEELVDPSQGDFEALVAHYLARAYRPFDRPGAGFGDLYPYGAALWPYFLARRHDDELVVRIWEACEDAGDDPDFLDATAAVLADVDDELTAAWIAHTRWNAATGAFADGSGYPDAGRLAEAPREVALAAPGGVGVKLEGMSARYLPVDDVPASARIVVEAERDAIAVGVRAPGAEITRVDGGADDAVARRHELEVRGASSVELVLTGVARGGLQQDVTIAVEALTEPPPSPPGAPVDDGGCAVGGGGVGLALAVVIVAGLRSNRAQRVRSAPEPR